MKKVFFPLIEENGMIVYPDDISNFTNTEIKIINEIKYIIADYFGSSTTIPEYIEQSIPQKKVITKLDFESRLPIQLQILLANPSFAVNQDGTPNIQLQSVLYLLARKISLSEALTPLGEKGVDVYDKSTIDGFTKAIEYGQITAQYILENYGVAI
jgi:hypothetical protein